MARQAPEFSFQPGDIVSRKDLHATFGGQGRGGISTPRTRPYIFVFTGSRGEAYGYEHAWESEVYHFTGEGHRGDMRFTRGNKALRDHARDGKRVFLFEERPEGDYWFLSEVVVRTWRTKEQADASGKVRQGIVFELARAGTAPQPATQSGLTLATFPE